MSIFKPRTDEFVEECKLWARGNYKPFDEIKGIWYPETQFECMLITLEADLEMPREQVIERLIGQPLNSDITEDPEGLGHAR